MTPDTIKLITNASIATVLAALIGLMMWLAHRERIAAMQDRDGIYRQLLERRRKAWRRSRRPTRATDMRAEPIASGVHREL